MSTPTPEDSLSSTPPASDKGVGDTPGEDNAPLQRPTPSTKLTPLAASPRNSLVPSATLLVHESEKNLEENVVEPQHEHRRSLFRRPIFWFAVAAAIVVVVLVVILPVYFTVIKPKNNTSTGGGNGGDGPGAPNGLTTGGDGSTVTTDNGTRFTYHNPFGGFCPYILFLMNLEGSGLTAESQGSGIRKTRLTTMPSQIHGRRL